MARLGTRLCRLEGRLFAPEDDPASLAAHATLDAEIEATAARVAQRLGERQKQCSLTPSPADERP